ncbi:hypothetical protein NEUTE2DRAFT_145964, partial [Neurospora tetrasperma FGSC 2509]
MMVGVSDCCYSEAGRTPRCRAVGWLLLLLYKTNLTKETPSGLDIWGDTQNAVVNQIRTCRNAISIMPIQQQGIGRLSQSPDATPASCR